MIKLRLALAVALSASAAFSQRVFVVDAAGGQGSHFRQVDVALAAAQAGDILLVRSGDYAPFAIDKGVHIFGTSARIVGLVNPFLPAISIDGIQAGQSVVVDGFDLSNATTLRPFLSVGSATKPNLGVVLLRNIVAPTLSIEMSSSVHVSESRFVSKGFVTSARVARSSVVFDRCELLGHWAALYRDSNSLGLYVDSADVTCSRCRISGGQGSFAPPAPAIDSRSSRLTLTGDIGGSQVSSALTVPVIRGSNSVIVDRASVFVGGASTIAITKLPVPSLVASGERIGGARELDLYTSGGTPYLLLLGSSGQPLAIPGIDGLLWIDLAKFSLVFDAGIVPASNRVVHKYQAPVQPSLLGVRFEWQGLAAEGGRFLLSNGATYAAH